MMLSWMTWIALLSIIQEGASDKAAHLLLEKREYALESPAIYAQGIRWPDGPAGEPVYYDPKPRVVPLDIKPGTYHLKWIGRDGEEKTLVYDRPDAFDAAVHASVSTTASGGFVYIYTVKNMRWSAQDISGLAVQNFSSQVTRPRMAKVHVGRMSNTIPQMQEGNWIRFGVLPSFRPLIPPGSSMEFRLESPSPPGLVRCRAHGGRLGIQGVGEDPPQELEEAWLGYEAWPSGYTIGPMDTLAQKPSASREHVLRHLDRIVQLGWMAPQTAAWYRENLLQADSGTLEFRLRQDLKNRRITSEVMAMTRPSGGI